MTIIHLMGMRSSKYGGLEKFMVELARQLKLKGFKLKLIYQELPYAERYINDLIDQKASIVIMPINGLINLMKFHWKFFLLLIKIHPKIVHFHFDPAGYLGLFVSLIFKIKTIRTMHSPLSDAASKEICENISQISLKTRILKRYMYYKTDVIFSVSNAIRDQFNKLFGVEGKIQTLYLGVHDVNFNKYASRIKYHLPVEKKIITCIAFHDYIKGIDILIKAIAILVINEKISNILVCQIGGDGNYTKKLYDYAKSLNVENYFLWLGYQNNTPEILAASDIYVQASRSEGISLALMEASFAKLPIVASNVGGIPEVVINEVTGLLFNDNNAELLADRLYYLLNNPTVGTELGRNAYNHARDKFLITNQVNRLIEEYSLIC